MIASALRNRDDYMRHAIYKRLDDAEKAKATGSVFYAVDQQRACIAEIDHRVNVIWDAYKRTIEDGRILWTDSVRGQILVRIDAMLDVAVPYLEEMARQVIVGHGHGFTLFLHDARPDIVGRVGAEMDLFELRHKPVGAAVRAQLQAPRYAGPREHWVRADRAMSQSPSDFAGAARESVNAVEGLAKIIVDNPTATLGDCIKLLKQLKNLDGALAKSLEALWGFANTSAGFRHGGHVTSSLSLPQAEYIIESCETASRLLLSLDLPARK